LAEKNKIDRQVYPQARKTYDACPHCGHELSPWQQVLLTIDRALVCKNCWYRIILEMPEEADSSMPPKEKE